MISCFLFNGINSQFIRFKDDFLRFRIFCLNTICFKLSWYFFCQWLWKKLLWLRSVLWGSSMLSSKVLHCLLFMLTYTQIYIYFNCQDGKFEWTVGWKDNWILKSMSNVSWSLFIVFNTYCPYIISVIKEDTVFVQIIDLKVIKEGFIG